MDDETLLTRLEAVCAAVDEDGRHDTNMRDRLTRLFGECPDENASYVLVKLALAIATQETYRSIKMGIETPEEFALFALFTRGIEIGKKLGQAETFTITDEEITNDLYNH